MIDKREYLIALARERHFGRAAERAIAAVPTALAMVASLTTPYRARHPEVSFTILSRTSIEILRLIENLEIDASVTYIDNERLGRVRSVPLYREQYRLLISADSPQRQAPLKRSIGNRASSGFRAAARAGRSAARCGGRRSA